jgi:CPA1 family monovalent cation:H+ antiporter
VFGTVVAVRIAWIIFYNRAAWLKERLMGRGYWPGDYRPTLAGSIIVSWCGMRGIVTLATAYALPPGFPFRDLILLCAFCVVVGTLVLQGVTLRPLILALGLKDDGLVDREVRKAREQLVRIALEVIDGETSPEADALRAEFASKLPSGSGGATPSEHDARQQLRSRIVEVQRAALMRMRDTAEIGDDAFHRIEERLDWTEVNVR